MAFHRRRAGSTVSQAQSGSSRGRPRSGMSSNSNRGRVAKIPQTRTPITRPSTSLPSRGTTTPQTTVTAQSTPVSNQPPSNVAGSDASPTADDVVMAISMRNDGSIGCAFYSLVTGSLQIMEDIPLGDIEFTERILLHIEPNVILIPPKVPEHFEASLRQYCDETNKENDDELVVLRQTGPGEFSYHRAFEGLSDIHEKHGNLGDTRFKTQAAQDCTSVKMMRLASTVSLECRISIECSAALLSDLRRRQEITDNPGRFQPREISMFTLKDFMFVNRDTLSALQVIQSEMHPNSLSWGGQDASSGSKESLSVYGLFHSLATSPLGKMKLRQLFLRPILDMDTIIQRQMTIEHLIRPENQEDMRQLGKAMRAIKNPRKTLDQLRAGTNQISGSGSSNNSI